MLLRRATRSLLWSATALLLPALAGGQGFALNEIGSCAVGRSFAVTAGGCSDASLVFWNPAATVRLDGWSVLAGAAAISLKGGYTQDTTGRKFDANPPTALVPHVFINRHLKGSKLALGGGVYVPYGLTSQWTDEPQFPGRFRAEKAALQSIYVQGNAAWQLNDKWSVGGGPIYVKSTVELQQGVDLSSQVAIPGVVFAQVGIPKGTQFADVTVKGGGHGYGGQFGLIGKLNDHWTMGVRYLTKVKITYGGADATFKQVNTGLVLPAAVGAIPAGTSVDALVASQFTTGKLTTQHAITRIVHPDQAQVGFNYTGFKDWNVEADYQLTGWKHSLGCGSCTAFKELVVSFDTVALSQTLIEDYNNSSSLRFSAERGFSNQARLRLGIAGATTAAPEATVTPLLPEQERAYYTIGGSWPLMNNLTLDGAFAHIATFGRRGRTDERASRAIGPEALNNGVYSLSANIFSFSLKASF